MDVVTESLFFEILINFLKKKEEICLLYFKYLRNDLAFRVAFEILLTTFHFDLERW